MGTSDYSRNYVGGRGLSARIYWDTVPASVKAFAPESRLVFATGPLAGLPVVGGSRWQICGKSAATIPEHFNYCNLGGTWGAWLKFAGYDALVIYGQAQNPLVLVISDGVAELKDAAAVWGKGAIETRGILKSEFGGSAKVVSIGPAGENRVTQASVLAENDASGSGGLGATMGSKRLKAIVVRSAKRKVGVARPERFQELVEYYRKLGASHSGVTWARDWSTKGPRIKKDPCYGCLGNCIRVSYESAGGKRGKFMCGSSFFYKPWAASYSGGQNQEEIAFHACKLCDDYGVDTTSIADMIVWLQRCYEAGILDDERTGISLSGLGSMEFLEALVTKVSLRQGFGDTLADGLGKAAKTLGARAVEQLDGYISKSGHGDLYSPRLYITTALMYATEPRPPMQQLHEVGVTVGKWLNWVKSVRSVEAEVSGDVIRAIAKRFWGGELAANFSTYDGKALAAKMIQDRETAEECLILCNFLWPIMWTDYYEDHVGDPSLESRLLSAVTGEDVDEEGFRRIGERVFNLQRAILVMEGHRGRGDDSLPDRWHTVPLQFDYANRECLVPGRNGEAVSRKGSVVERGEFERMKDEYYHLRGWDVGTGLQTREKLDELDLNDVSDVLGDAGLMR